MSDLTKGNEVDELAQESDENHRRRVSRLAAHWPRPARDHSELLLRQQQQRRDVVPAAIVFIPIFHGRDDPAADARLEKDIGDLFDAELVNGDAIVSGETYTIPYSPEVEQRAQRNTLGELDKTIRALAPDYHLNQQAPHVAGFERAMRRMMRLRPEIPVAGFESRSGSILATLLEQAPTLVGVSPVTVMEPKWCIGIEARTRQALNRAADHFGPIRLFFIAGGLHGPGVSNWCRRNGVEFQMAVSDVMAEKLPQLYGPNPI